MGGVKGLATTLRTSLTTGLQADECSYQAGPFKVRKDMYVHLTLYFDVWCRIATAGATGSARTCFQSPHSNRLRRTALTLWFYTAIRTSQPPYAAVDYLQGDPILLLLMAAGAMSLALVLAH